MHRRGIQGPVHVGGPDERNDPFMGPDQVCQAEVHVLAEAAPAELAPAEPDGGQALDGAGDEPEQQECADVLVKQVGGAGPGQAYCRHHHQHQRDQVETVEQAQQAQGRGLEVEQYHQAVEGGHRHQVRRYAEPGSDQGYGQHARQGARDAESQVQQRGKFDQFLEISPGIALQAQCAVPDHALRGLQGNKVPDRDRVGVDKDEYAEIVGAQGAGGQGQVGQAGQGRIQLARGQHGGVPENPAVQAVVRHQAVSDKILNASQILSTCSSVWAALTLMRTSDLPPGVAGGKIRFT